MGTRYEQYLRNVEGLEGAIGACVVEVGSGELLARGADQDEALTRRLVAAAAVLRAQQEAAQALGLGEQVEALVISQEREHHVLRMLTADAGCCCALGLTRQGSNLALALLALVEAEEALKGA